jgi:hypothetical protein
MLKISETVKDVQFCGRCFVIGLYPKEKSDNEKAKAVERAKGWD